MFWFFPWRMTLWGLGLGSGLGTTYGLLVGGLTFPYGVGFLLVGPLFGVVGGLVLGVLCGAVLLILTLAYRPWDASRYRTVAGLVCAAACLTALALFFEITARKSGTSFVSQPSAYLEDMGSMLIMIVGPSLVATGAAWWAGRRVAEQYTREFGEPVSRSPEQASGEWLWEKGRRK